MVATPGNKLRVLVVEDHQDTRLLLKAILESMGHRAAVAATLEEGRACLGTSEFDVAFSDIRLPDGMGWELLQGLTLPPHFLAVAMSGHLDSYLDEMEKAGFCHRIDKPFSRAEIETTLKRARPVRAELEQSG